MPTTYAIPDGRTVMATTLYTGTNASLAVSNAVNGVGMQPDFLWIKSRTTAANHALMDSIRGVANQLQSSTTNAESTNSAGKGLQSFNTGGFTLGQESDAVGGTNANGASYVAWQWKAGTTSASNTNGSITSTVSAGATQGFSVATYTGNGSAGATFGHGLGVTPAMIIIKARTATAAENWFVYHQNLTAVTYYLRLNSTNAQTDGGSSGATSRVTAISSSVITLGPNAEVNESTKTYVAYVFSAVAGYSAFGSYTGNGSSDGPFLYTGFRPRFIMTKRTNTTGDWLIFDTSRDTYNVAGQALYPNYSVAEVNYGTGSGAGFWDFLSNGFKIRSNSVSANNSGDTYIYVAFAENPFKYANAR